MSLSLSPKNNNNKAAFSFQFMMALVLPPFCFEIHYFPHYTCLMSVALKSVIGLYCLLHKICSLTAPFNKVLCLFSGQMGKSFYFPAISLGTDEGGCERKMFFPVSFFICLWSLSQATSYKYQTSCWWDEPNQLSVVDYQCPPTYNHNNSIAIKLSIVNALQNIMKR